MAKGENDPFTVSDVITFDRAIMGIHPIFTDTEVPIQVIFDYIHNYSSVTKAIDIFLQVYPTEYVLKRTKELVEEEKEMTPELFEKAGIRFV